jgi:putative heme-binding domain-containing protein
MFGSLYVVDDLEQYLADPEAYVAQYDLKPVDELLKFNRPRKEWKFDELAGQLDKLEGRSFANARQMFQVASCVACHKLNGAGQEFGPDLAKLDAKQTPTDILRSILEPSHKIEDKYVSYIFELDSGKSLTGMVVEERPDALLVIENPLAAAKPLVISKAEIVSREKSPSSIMPKGLLDKMTRDEILDLVGYIVARGDSHNALFGSGHEHAHAGGH